MNRNLRYLRMMRLSAGSIRRVALRTVTILLLAVAANRAGAQSVADTLARDLDSASVGARYDAVAALGMLSLPQIPAAVRTRLIALLEAEGVTMKSGTLPTVASDTISDETYPGYITALATLVLEFADTRSLRGLALTGLGISRTIQNFVVQNGAQSLPFLDEAYTSPTARHSVLLTWGLMLSPSGSTLTTAQKQTIKQKLLSAVTIDALGVVWAARLGGLADLEPVVKAIAASSSDPIVSSRAAQVDTILNAARASQTNSAILTGARDWLTAMCLGSTGARHGACQSLDNHFDDSIKHLTQGNGNAERNALSALIDKAGNARDHGDLTAFEASILIDAANRVLATL